MSNVLTKLILLCLLSLGVFADTYVVSLFPKKDATEVKANIKVKITFDKQIIHSSIKKHTIILKTSNKKIKGKISIQDKKILLFTPKQKLKTGKYSLHVKNIKLKNNKLIKPRT